MKNKGSKCLKRTALGMVLSFILSGQAKAADVYITAEFKADIANPEINTFVNTTPMSPLCSNGHVEECTQNGWWSINTGITGFKTPDQTQIKDRGAFYIGMPATKDVTITSSHGTRHTLHLDITGGALRLNTPYPSNSGISLSRDPLPPERCYLALNNRGYGHGTMMRMYMRHVEYYNTKSGCSSGQLPAADGNQAYIIPSFDFIYRMRTPSPLDMVPGEYTGSVSYTIGGSVMDDFDLGEGAVTNDNIINVHFLLKVKHAFYVRFLSPTMDAVLQPENGWKQWTDYGRLPSRLKHELSFSLSSSTNYNIRLECEHLQADGRCAMKNTDGTGNAVPFDVSVTLPGSKTIIGNRDAVNVPVTQTPTEFGTDGQFIVQRQSYLSFAVNNASDIKEMLNHPGSRYKGSVNVIFDAQLD